MLADIGLANYKRMPYEFNVFILNTDFERGAIRSFRLNCFSPIAVCLQRCAAFLRSILFPFYSIDINIRTQWIKTDWNHLSNLSKFQWQNMGNLFYSHKLV